MIPRRSIPVDALARSVPERVRITHEPGPGGGFYLESFDGEQLAGCESAKRLSDWAFENGAQEVRHDYDGKLSDDEP